MKKFFIALICLLYINSPLFANSENMYQSPFSSKVETPTIDYLNNSRTYNLDNQFGTESEFRSNTWGSTSTFRSDERSINNRTENDYTPLGKSKWNSTSYFSNSEMFSEKKDFTMADDNLTTSGKEIIDNTGDGVHTKDTGTGVVEPIPDSIILLVFGCLYALHIRRKKQQKSIV